MIQKAIASFQVLTQDHPRLSHGTQALSALRGGAKWIQLRSKEKSRGEITTLARELKIICRDFGAHLIINDHAEIAGEAGADGVHLGKSDLSVAEARSLLGRDFIIGGTANTLEDIGALAEAGVDYAGIGPFRFTETKKKLAPILGLEGIRRLVSACRAAGIQLPLIAIGGIGLEDVASILETGVFGLAVSSAINLSQKPEKVVADFLQKMKNAPRAATII